MSEDPDNWTVRASAVLPELAGKIGDAVDGSAVIVIVLRERGQAVDIGTGESRANDASPRLYQLQEALLHDLNAVLAKYADSVGGPGPNRTYDPRNRS